MDSPGRPGAPVLVIMGVSGSGKSTVAGALALALAAGGRKVLLVEVEGRQGMQGGAQSRDQMASAVSVIRNPGIPVDATLVVADDRTGPVR